MPDSNSGAVRADEVLDVQGEICPYPQIYTKKKLESMAAGKTLLVLTDHPPAGEETIPHLCQAMNYPCVVEKKGPVYRIRIQKVVPGR